jgi:hypothetical protein
VALLAGCAALVQVPLAELLLELDADPDEVEELEVAAGCVQVGGPMQGALRVWVWVPRCCGVLQQVLQQPRVRLESAAWQ